MTGTILTIILVSMMKWATVDGSSANQWIGYSRGISSAGDVNGDGYADLMYTEGGYQRVCIVLGGTNFDGNPDIFLYPPVLHTNDNFGVALAGECDINNDGFGDVVVTCMNSHTNPTASGEVYVYYGGTNMDGNADITLCSPEWGDDYGYDVDVYKPYSEDPHYDILVGAPQSQNYSGKAYIYPGYYDYNQVYLLNPLWYGIQGARFGESVCAGYLDNATDAIILVGGSAYQADQGVVMVFSPEGVLFNKIYGPGGGSRFGWDLAAGDVTHDGLDDLFISAYRAYPNAVYVSYGRTNWQYYDPIPINNQVLYGDNNNIDDFGFRISCCDDINHDGRGDVLIGAPQMQTGNPGKAFVYYGGEGQIDRKVDWKFTGYQNDSYSGHGVAGIGDMNSIGNTCFAIGAPYYDRETKTDAGQIYIFGDEHQVTPPGGGMSYGNTDAVSILRINHNPFHDRAFLEICGSKNAFYGITIFNVNGQKMIEWPLVSANSQITWDGNDNKGNPVQQGVYFIRAINSRDGSYETIKIVKMK